MASGGGGSSSPGGGTAPGGGSAASGGGDSGARPNCPYAAHAKGLTTHAISGTTYAVYVPASYQSTTPMRAIVALHGTGDSPTNFITYLWKANADAQGLIIVAPKGTFFSNGQGPAWSNADLPRVLAALDEVQSCFNVAPKRTLVSGFSAGAHMAYFVGLKQAQRFAGIAIAAGSLYGGAEYLNGGASLFPAAWKVPVVHFHGTQDQSVPYGFGEQSRDKLVAAGHPVQFHAFSGGHTTSPAQALQALSELAPSSAP